MREAAELVVRILEEVRVDRPELETKVVRVRRELTEVVDAIPGNVKGNRRRDARQAVYLRSVLEFLERVARHPGLSEHGKARARVPERPGGLLDPLRS